MGIIPKGLLSETLFFDGIFLKTEKAWKQDKTARANVLVWAVLCGGAPDRAYLQ